METKKICRPDLKSVEFLPVSFKFRRKAWRLRNAFQQMCIVLKRDWKEAMQELISLMPSECGQPRRSNEPTHFSTCCFRNFLGKRPFVIALLWLFTTVKWPCYLHFGVVAYRRFDCNLIRNSYSITCMLQLLKEYAFFYCIHVLAQKVLWASQYCITTAYHVYYHAISRNYSTHTKICRVKTQTKVQCVQNSLK